MKFFSVIVFAFFFIYAVQAREAKCPTVCPLVFQQTCGFNGRCYKIFSNPCNLNKANCIGQGNFRRVDVEECSKLGARIC